MLPYFLQNIGFSLGNIRYICRKSAFEVNENLPIFILFNFLKFFEKSQLLLVLRVLDIARVKLPKVKIIIFLFIDIIIIILIWIRKFKYLWFWFWFIILLSQIDNF